MLARSVILNLAGTLGSLVIGFASSLLVARWLGSSERGLFGLMQSAGEIAADLAGLGIPFAVVYAASRKDANQRAIFGAGLTVAAALAAVFVPLAWFLRAPIADALARGAGGEAWLIAGLVVPTTFLYWATHNQLHAALRFGALNVLLVVSKLTALLLVVALVGIAGRGVGGALLSVVGASLTATIGTIVVLRGPRPSFDPRVFRHLLHYGVRVQTGTVFQILNYRLDVFVLQAFRPLDAVGYYVVAQIVAELTTMLASAFQTTIMPLIARSDEDDSTTVVASLRHHSLLAAAATLLNAGFGTLLIAYGYGPEFRPALVPMLILLPGIWFLGTGRVVAGVLRGRDRPGLASALAGVGVVVTLALDFALIPRFGVVGAAVASVCAYLVYGVASLAALSRITALPLKTFVVPTRIELAAYPAALRRLRGRLRSRGTPGPRAPG